MRQKQHVKHTHTHTHTPPCRDNRALCTDALRITTNYTTHCQRRRHCTQTQRQYDHAASKSTNTQLSSNTFQLSPDQHIDYTRSAFVSHILYVTVFYATVYHDMESTMFWTGTVWCLQKEIATYRHWSVSLWRDPDNVPRCRILSPDKTEWLLISATLCRWRRCFVAHQLWFMKCIREEEQCFTYW